MGCMRLNCIFQPWTSASLAPSQRKTEVDTLRPTLKIAKHQAWLHPETAPKSNPHYKCIILSGTRLNCDISGQGKILASPPLTIICTKGFHKHLPNMELKTTTHITPRIHQINIAWAYFSYYMHGTWYPAVESRRHTYTCPNWQHNTWVWGL